jgi:DNA-binding transcriptional MerR regulator
VEQKLLRAGQLAGLLGVSSDLLRHYERIGVLPPPVRASNGYRLYSPQSVDRVRAIRRSLRLGFSLAELSGIFTMRDRGGSRAEASARWPRRSCVVWNRPFKNFEDYGGTFVRLYESGTSCWPKPAKEKGRGFSNRWARRRHLAIAVQLL